jgi:hypothetical protein
MTEMALSSEASTAYTAFYPRRQKTEKQRCQKLKYFIALFALK